jgi:hypothetical protein
MIRWTTLRDDELEWKLRAIAVPAAVVLAFAFHAWPTGHFLQRTFLSMILHELGHAVTAWWCGFAALPGLWKTMIPEARGVIVPVVIAAAEVAAIYVGWRTRRWLLAAAGGVLAVAQIVGTLATGPHHAHAAITFGGDAGAMVLGTLLMFTFFAPADSRLVTNHLRWGFLVIGAAALVDPFMTWWSARTDEAAIPFGEIEGVGLSDPSKLVEDYGWSTQQLVGRYVVVGIACFLALAAVWGYFTWAARRARPADPAAEA